MEETYEEDLTEGRAIELEFRYFANRLSKRLRRRSFMDTLYLLRCATMISLTVSRQKTFRYTIRPGTCIFETALILWNKLMQDKTSKRPKEAKKDTEPLGATTKGKVYEFLNVVVQRAYLYGSAWPYTTIRSYCEWSR